VDVVKSEEKPPTKTQPSDEVNNMKTKDNETSKVSPVKVNNKMMMHV
jgi:hypothetical protein